ncbi:hypothetical protein J6500_23270 [Bradyrhizobium sp. WSM 1704]|uniref:hypothetical protein n=1 Tax=Bradyrhizobium semiaridum TaxID=2821404 RepID=UPI001CE3516E|nr:hypothetical protein [Bradyrhizobium semiaridum]MCA6124793.1 hypothetical protein [Bradyrhizobium semiaridum]
MDLAMRAARQPSSLSLIVGSYLADWRRWIGRLITSYALAGGLMLMGAVSLLIAIGIGVAAGFHAIEVRYGIWIAYAAIGGAFVLLGLLGLVIGRVLLARPAPHVPRGSRQAGMLKRAVAAPVATRLIATTRSGADTTTQAMAAGAVILLAAWLAASRFRRRHAAAQD